ncbi:MAG: tetratricopeptide repeat protein [Fusobacteriaceae bacterium]
MADEKDKDKKLESKNKLLASIVISFLLFILVIFSKNFLEFFGVKFLGWHFWLIIFAGLLFFGFLGKFIWDFFRNIKTNLWNIFIRLLVIIILPCILYFGFTLSSVKKDVINLNAKIGSVKKIDNSMISSEDENYYKKTVEEVRANTDFIEWFFGTLATLGVALIGIQIFKNEKGYKVNLEILKRQIADQDKKIKESDFNFKLGLAINKNIISEKLEALKELTKTKEYNIYLGLLYYYMGYFSYDNNVNVRYFTTAINNFEKNNKKYCEEYSESFSLRGTAYWNLGNHDKAKEDFDTVIKLNNSSEKTVLLCKSSIERINKKYERAITYLDELITKYPIYWRAYNARGNVKSSLKNYQEALVDYNKSIELNHNYSFTYNNRGLAKYNLDDCQGAISDYNKSIELNSNFTKVYFNRGLAKEKSNDLKGALEDYRKVLELNPKDDETSTKITRLEGHFEEHPELLKK